MINALVALIVSVWTLASCVCLWALVVMAHDEGERAGLRHVVVAALLPPVFVVAMVAWGLVSLLELLGLDLGEQRS